MMLFTEYLIIVSPFLDVVTVFTEVAEQQLLLAQTPGDLTQNEHNIGLKYFD